MHISHTCMDQTERIEPTNIIVLTQQQREAGCNPQDTSSRQTPSSLKRRLTVKRLNLSADDDEIILDSLTHRVTGNWLQMEAQVAQYLLDV